MYKTLKKNNKYYAAKTKQGYKYELSNWTQPVLSANYTITNDGAITISASAEDTPAFKPMASDAATGSNTEWYVNTSGTCWWQINFPYQLKITQLKYYNISSNNSTAFTKTAQFFTDSTSKTPLGNAFTAGQASNAETVIAVNGVVTSTIYLKITNSYGSYSGMSKLVITAKKATPVKTNSNADFYMDTYLMAKGD